MRHTVYKRACLTGLSIFLLLSSCSVISPAPNDTAASRDLSSSISTAATPAATTAATTAASTAASQDNGTSEEDGSIPTQEITALNSYDMHLTLDTENHTIGGTETVTVYNDSEDTWNELCFRDYPSLFAPGGGSGYDSNGAVSEINQVKDLTNGFDLEMIRSKDDVSVINIDLSVPLKTGESRKIELNFTAYIPELGSRYGYLDDVYNLANFYPVLAVYENGGWSTEPYFLWGECFYSKVSNYKASISVPLCITVISSGLSHIDTISGGRATWEISAKKVRDFAVVAGTGFAVTSKKVDGITINCYYRNNAIEWGAAALEAGALAVQTYDRNYGQYPYPELDIVETHLDAGGMEYPNIVMISDNLDHYAGKNSYMRIVVVHEVAHQWFYGLVGDNQYTEAWLDESFASFCELIYKETFTDEQAINQEVDNLEESMKPEGIPDTADTYYINRAYSEFDNNNAYTYTVYMRGEIFLFRLREVMGRDAFNMAIKDYVDEYSLKVATTNDFEAVIKKYAGENPDVAALLAKYLRQQ